MTLKKRVLEPNPRPARQRMPSDVAESAFDPTRNPPSLAQNPLQVVILMRHGDRTPVRDKISQLDMSSLNLTWATLLPTTDEVSALNGIHVERASGAGQNAYATFVGHGCLGQLTRAGFHQCQNAGKELRRRYGHVEIQAFSTDFPRTIQSAASVLVGFTASTESGANPSKAPSTPRVLVRAPREQTLLPNYDGRCRRFAEGRRAAMAKAESTKLKALRDQLEAALLPLIGEEPLSAVLDFKPHCVHRDAVGEVPGIDWDLAHLVEHYKASLEAAVYADITLLRLGSGRLMQEVMDILSAPGRGITLLMAHDNMLTAFLVALGVSCEQWPLYASQVVLETAKTDTALEVRVLMNDEVCLDWQPMADLYEKVRPVAMSKQEYEAALTDA